MASFRSALVLLSIYILVTLSGLGDCRVPFQSEQVVAGIGENEQIDHLLLPSENEDSSEIAKETRASSTLPLKKPDLKRNNEIFHGERSRGFIFGRPGGCHHEKSNHMEQRKSENMHFPVEFMDLQAGSGDFHPRIERPLSEERHFGPGFPKGIWRHPEEEKRGKENEHVPFPARRGWLEFFFHPFLRHDDAPGFHPREDEFRPEFGHGFPRMDEFHPREDEFRPKFGHSFPRMDEFHPRDDEFKPELGHEFPGVDKFNPEVDEFRPKFGHGFPGVDKFNPRVDEFRPEFEHGFPSERIERGENEQFSFSEEQEESFPHSFPEPEEFHSRVEEFMPLQRDFEHEFPGEGGRQPENGHGEEEKGNEQQMHLPIESVRQAEPTEFRSNEEVFLEEKIMSTD